MHIKNIMLVSVLIATCSSEARPVSVRGHLRHNISGSVSWVRPHIRNIRGGSSDYDSGGFYYSEPSWKEYTSTASVLRGVNPNPPRIVFPPPSLPKQSANPKDIKDFRNKVGNERYQTAMKYFETLHPRGMETAREWFIAAANVGHKESKNILNQYYGCSYEVTQ